MYGKLFASMYEGTLYGRWQAIITLQQMIILADEDGVIDMTPPSLAARTSIPLDIIETGLEQLSQTDKYSRTPGEDGRRIVLIDPARPWGWRIVNYVYYRNLASREDKKRKDRERIAEKRNGISDVATCRNLSQNVADVAHTNTDTNTDTDIRTPPTPPDGGKRARGAPLAASDLHDSLPREAWDEWLDHRRQKRMPCDGTTLRKQLAVLREHDTNTQAQMLATSINAGWQGVFPLRTGQQRESKADMHRRRLQELQRNAD